jgi:hypothetical protein
MGCWAALAVIAFLFVPRPAAPVSLLVVAA